MPLNRLSQVFDTLSIRSLPNQTNNLLDIIGVNGEQIASLTSAPFLMIGSGIPGVPLHIRNSNSSYSSPIGANVPALMAENLNNASGTAHSILGMRVGGTNGGDPFISFDINNVIGWSVGLDNSDSDKFKISESWSDVGTRTAITLSPGSIFSLNSTSLNLGASSAAHQFAVVSNASTNVVSVLRGAASQVADLAQWQNSAGTSLTSINSSGHFLTPRINFTGGTTTISALTLADGTVSFEGTAGQLFSVSNSLTGTIFSINDISGLPSVEVTDLGIIKLNELYGQTVVGSGTPATSAQLSTIARTSATIPLVVRGASGQSVNLQEWQNSTPTTVASISNTGAITAVDLTLSGNLTVNGTTTNINTTNLVVEDKNIILGDVASPSTTTADGGGLTLLAGGSNKTFNWVNATDRWTSSVGLEGASIVRTGGTSSQFLKADGSVDSSTYLTGNQSISLSGDITGTGTTAITTTLANSGVAAGTYRSVTVNVKGLVTGGTNPTTLSGYGITDALDTSATAQTKSGNLTAAQFIRSGGTSSQFLKADGSVDSSTYLTTGTASSTYAALSGATFTGAVIAPAATTSIPSIRLPHGTAPTSPTNGDIWTTTGGMYVRVNGATVGPLAANPMTTLGDIIYGGASGTPTRLAGSASTSVVILSQLGSGTNSAAPTWRGTTGYGGAVVLSNDPDLGTNGIGGLRALGLSGTLISTASNSTTPNGGQIYLNGATGNRIDFNANGLAAPSTTTVSVGTKITIYPTVTPSTVDYAIGAESTAMWFSVANTSAVGFKFYGGTTNIATLSGAGALTLSSSATATSFIPSSSTVPANGVYLPATNTVGISSNSTQRMTFDANGSLKFFGQVAESATTSATAATGTINYDVMSNKNVLYYTSNSSANWTLNIRGNASTSLNTLMDTGQSLTVVFMATNGATAYYQTGFQIDGTSVTPKWQGGTTPSSGNANSIDVYVINIIKTASATYTVFESQTRFA